ncbi:MAG TPA: roadblock/LC7 domain-containing protein [Gemmatimonadaceae bacterium]|jgi:predicted regulator of Ras-like GTPase activity (Roadblock/LC7/MglB family)|nr:roadblock/LC7 domain-containing protein [Gemmatimonadaceae bacterium]
MPTIRDLVSALRQREGVDAAIVLGRDGLLIDSSSAPAVDADSVAALVPSVVAAADELGRQTERGGVTTAVLEYPAGFAIVSSLTADAVLLVLAGSGAQVGRLLFELRRHRENIAALV